MNAAEKADMARMIDYRKKHFAVEVTTADWMAELGEGGAVTLSVTHNGNQWTSISLSRSEIPKVIKALKTAL